MKQSRSHLNSLPGLLPLVLLLGVWQLTGDPESPFSPAPSSWWPALFTLDQGDKIIPAVIDTVRTFGLGLIVATILGVALGLSIGASRLFNRATGPPSSSHAPCLRPQSFQSLRCCSASTSQ